MSCRSWAHFSSYSTRLTSPVLQNNMTSGFIRTQMTHNFTSILTCQICSKRKINLSPACGRFKCGVPQCALDSTHQKQLIWFYRGSRDVHPLSGCSLQLDQDCSIIPVETVRDLGVILDGALKMNAHITSVTRSCFYHLRRIRQVKRCLNERCLRVLVQALVMSRIDYCNAFLTGLPAVVLHLLKTSTIVIILHLSCANYTGFQFQQE